MDHTWKIPKAKYINLKVKTNDYCLIIPVINEGERIQNQLKKLSPYTNKVDILIADGGSTDNSLNEEFLKSVNVTALLIKEDIGKLSAQLRIAYAFALKQGYKGIITMDGNDKDGVKAIPNFIKELENGVDFIQGSRFVKGGVAINTPSIRHWAIKLIHAPFISLIAKERFTDTTNGYRGYSRKYLLDERVLPFRDTFQTYELLAYLSVRASQLGMKTSEIPVVRAYPADGKIPTKISSFSGNFELIKILFKLLTGTYNPK